jgi:hypothetical protein
MNSISMISSRSKRAKQIGAAILIGYVFAYVVIRTIGLKLAKSEGANGFYYSFAPPSRIAGNPLLETIHISFVYVFYPIQALDYQLTGTSWAHIPFMFRPPDSASEMK